MSNVLGKFLDPGQDLAQTSDTDTRSHIDIFELKNVDDVERVIDALKEEHATIVKLDKLGDKLKIISARERITGAMVALDGALEELNDVIYLVTPKAFKAKNISLENTVKYQPDSDSVKIGEDEKSDD